MREDFLHYLWRYQLFNKQQLQTTEGESVSVVSVGYRNDDSGPDFKEAQIKIGDKLWVGNVEIHLNSADWYVHNHEQDPAYDNVILHVVWEDTMPVYRRNNTIVSTLVLAGLVPKYLRDNYSILFKNQQKWIACEKLLDNHRRLEYKHWFERLYVERLQKKTIYIESLLQSTSNDWEAVLFILLLKNFGLKVNGAAFAEIGRKTSFSNVRKEQSSQKKLEALLLGQAGLLEVDADDFYLKDLKELYKFQKIKYHLNEFVPVQFFRLRPPNFPNIRLAQVADLYSKNKQLFQKIIKEKTLEDLYNLLQAKASSYWNTHYSFGKVSKKSVKRTTKSFLELLIINTVIPIKFAYQKATGQIDSEAIFKLVGQLKTEQNSIVKSFNERGIIATNALESQALLTLKNEYCDRKNCLQCEIGMKLLNR